MNPQNLSRPAYDEDGKIIPGSDDLRRSLIAPKGYVLVVCDSGQIECRGVNLLAGQDDMVETFRLSDRKEGPDPYRVMAGDIYSADPYHVTKQQRFVGKVAELGLGYQMGAPKFQRTLAIGAMGPPVEIELFEAKRVVNLYRRRHYKVKELWDAAQDLLKRMFMGGSGTFYDLFEYTPNRIYKPGGLALCYDNIAVQFDENTEREKITYFNGKHHTKIYGGLLVENLIQSICRDIVAEQALRISKELPIITLTHDEIVALAPEKDANDALKFMLGEMKTPPIWWPEFPLNAEGGYDICYSK